MTLTTSFSATNSLLASGTQLLEMNLDSSNIQVQFLQKYKPTGNVYSSNDLGQRFIFGSWGVNPLELSSTLSAGTVTSNIKTNTIIQYSDIRLKQNIKTLESNQGVEQIRVVQYDSIADNSTHYGVIAHELAEIFPNLVKGEKEKGEMQSVSYIELIPLCINEIQNLKKENISIQTRMEALECFME